jgi:hypothetical protein
MKIINECRLLIITKYKIFIQYLYEYGYEYKYEYEYEYEYAGGIKINRALAIVLNWM